MRRPHKVIVGILSFLPLLLASFYATGVGERVVNVAAEPLSTIVAVILLLGAVASVALLIFYLAHVYFHPRLSTPGKVLWLVLLALGNVLTMPLYWFLHVWGPIEHPFHAPRRRKSTL